MKVTYLFVGLSLLCRLDNKNNSALNVEVIILMSELLAEI
jgi:hypothetical protein